MRNNPKLDSIAEAYTSQVVGDMPGMIVMEIEPEQDDNHCPHAARGCTCGNCPECAPDEESSCGGSVAEQELTAIINAATELLNNPEALQGLDGVDSARLSLAVSYISEIDNNISSSCNQSPFNMGHEDVVVEL